MWWIVFAALAASGALLVSALGRPRPVPLTIHQPLLEFLMNRRDPELLNQVWNALGSSMTFNEKLSDRIVDLVLEDPDGTKRRLQELQNNSDSLDRQEWCELFGLMVALQLCCQKMLAKQGVEN